MESTNAIKSELEEVVNALEEYFLCRHDLTFETYQKGMYAIPNAIALIQQLQANNAQQARCIENMIDMLNAAHEEVAKLQVERDVAVANVRRSCCTCKHRGKDVREKPCSSCRRNGYGGIKESWQWCGVQKEED